MYSREAGEIVIEAPDGQIPDQTANQMLDVLNNLNDCTEKAHRLLKDVKIDLDTYPHALDKGFAVCGIYSGHFRRVHNPDENGFVMTFTTVEYYPLDFSVKFHYPDRHPFTLEAWGCE